MINLLWNVISQMCFYSIYNNKTTNPQVTYSIPTINLFINLISCCTQLCSSIHAVFKRGVGWACMVMVRRHHYHASERDIKYRSERYNCSDCLCRHQNLQPLGLHNDTLPYQGTAVGMDTATGSYMKHKYTDTNSLLNKMGSDTAILYNTCLLILRGKK